MAWPPKNDATEMTTSLGMTLFDKTRILQAIRLAYERLLESIGLCKGVSCNTIIISIYYVEGAVCMLNVEWGEVQVWNF